MKIVYLQLCSKGIEQKEMTQAIRNINPNAEFIKYDWLTDFKKDPEIARNQINSLISKLSYNDLVFAQIQRHNLIMPRQYKLLDDIKKKGIKFLNWSGDVREGKECEWYEEFGKHIYCTAFTNMEDVNRLKVKRINAEYLQIGFETSIFKPEGEKISSPDIVFMGNNNNKWFPCSEERTNMVKLLVGKFGDQYKTYGKSWEKIGIKADDINNQFEMEAKVYRSAKVAIGQNHFIRERYSSDRIFRAMGSGCFMLSKNYPGIELEFDIGKHLDTWSNLDELVEKVNYYLNNDDKRIETAKNGCDHVRREHSWLSRTKDMKRIFNV